MPLEIKTETFKKYQFIYNNNNRSPLVNMKTMFLWKISAKQN